MNRVGNLKEYLNILKNAKRQCEAPITNMYLLLDSVKKYVEEGRFYYQMQNSGACFFCDEELYYRMFYYLDVHEGLSVESMDKPIAVRNIYNMENKKEELFRLEKTLKQTEFAREYSSMEMCVPVECGETIAKQKELYDRILKKGKFRIAGLRKEDLNEMLAMRRATPEFHIYNFEYKSIAEYYSEIENGQYVGVYNERDEMCANIYTTSGLNFRTGDGICVKQEYKQKYGLGAGLMIYVLDEALNGYQQNYVSWCEKENTKSMEFHKKIGFQNTGKIADEWIRRE